ncbi:hypothetical protein [Brucella sp. BO2]|uniref:hypothetical protein n=1 Tax=Brucella sp. BO2 TaxID=693750 RepID=UPI00046CA3F7|nr:hypothetical protein [Brucella sp. BO2]
MSKIETGGPAFPNVGSHGNIIEPGMTLRDYIAAHIRDLDDLSVPYAEALCGRELPYKNAPVGLLNAEQTIEIMKFWADADARYRFIRADAMLAARGGDRD